MYHSIAIGAKNTWDDWHVVPTSRPLFSVPAVKTNYVDIPGGNGALDFTEVLTGYPLYNNREGSWEFSVVNGAWSSWTEAYSTIMADIHGKKLKAVLEDDPLHYYEGRFSLNEWRSDPDWSSITIDYNVAPFKYNIWDSQGNVVFNPFNASTEAQPKLTPFTVNSSGWVTFTIPATTVGPIAITPTINANLSSGTVIDARFYNPELGISNVTATLNAGDNLVPTYVLSGMSSTNNMRMYLKGYGTVTLKYNGGML